MVVNKYAKYKQPAPAEQEQEPAPQNKYRKYLQPVPTPTPAAPANPSLRSETDAIIEEAAANIPGGFAAFDAKLADPKRMAAMGYVPDPLAKSGYAKPRAPEAPIVDSGNTTNAFTDVMRGLEAPIVGLTGNALEGWAKTTSQDPVRGASEAVDFISPVDDLGRAYQGVKQAGAGLIEGDMAKAAEGAQQASIQGSYAAMQMLPGSMTLKGVTGRAAPTTMAGAERAAVQASRAPQVVKPQAKPEPVLTPPSEAPKPFSAPPEPIGRGVVRRNLDRIIGGGVGATLGGTGDAMAAPGDGDSGGLPGGAATGAAIGIFGPRALAAAGSRGFRAAARAVQSPTSRAGFDERVAARAVRKALVSGGINTEQDALNAARAKFGDKPASVADLTQEGVGMSAGLSRLPGATGDAARARGEDLIETRSGRLARDVEQSTGFSTAAVSGDIEQLAKEAMERATPQYNALRAQYPEGSLTSPRLTKIEGIGQHTKAVDDYRAATAANEGRAVGDFEYWDLVKRDIDAKEQQLINSGATMDDIRLRKLESARAALVKELDGLIPEYAAARQLGGEAPKIRGAFKEGQTYIGGRFSADEVAAKISEYTGAPLTAAQAGAIRTILGKTEGAGAAVAALRSARAKKQLEAVFGKAKADEIQARFAADAALVQNSSRINPNVGSATSQAGMGGGGGVQQAAELLQAGWQYGTSPFRSILAAISKSGSYTKAQRDLMGQMLLDGVTPENVARIFAGKKPKGGTTPPAGPTTGLGGPAASAASGAPDTALGTSLRRPEQAGFGGSKPTERKFANAEEADAEYKRLTTQIDDQRAELLKANIQRRDAYEKKLLADLGATYKTKEQEIAAKMPQWEKDFMAKNASRYDEDTLKDRADDYAYAMYNRESAKLDKWRDKQEDIISNKAYKFEERLDAQIEKWHDAQYEQLGSVFDELEFDGTRGNPEALGAAGGTGLGFATAPDQNGDGTVDAQERMMGAAGGAISGVLGVKGLGAASGLAAKAMKGGKPKAPAVKPKPAFDQRFMKEAQRLVSYNGGVDKALKAQQYVIDQLKNSKAPNAQDRVNRAVSVQYAIRRMAEKSNRELDEIVPMAQAAPTGPKPIDPSTNYNIDPRGDKFVIRTDAGEEVLGAPQFSDRKQALAWLQGETRKARKEKAPAN